MKNNKFEQIGVAILCGGLSSRMGQDKADLPVRGDITGKSFLDKLSIEFEDFKYKYISINANQNHSAEGYISICDEYQEIGPLGGIYSVLKQSEVDAVFFIACDMPNFSREAVDSLIDKWDGVSVALSMVDNKREPLASIYTKACIPIIEKFISEKKYKLGLLFNEMQGQYIDMTEYADCYVNINTMEEYFAQGK